MFFDNVILPTNPLTTVCTLHLDIFLASFSGSTRRIEHESRGYLPTCKFHESSNRDYLQKNSVSIKHNITTFGTSKQTLTINLML